MSVISQKLSDLGITLVSPGAPAAAYVMAVTTGHQVF
ncbi:MAG: RidA family protein, partial [Betaproteobacteria bacterium]|nr:RidA family protein [Betaproteobacteria bacterium]